MSDEQSAFLKALAIRVDALRRAIEMVMKGTTEDYAKWSACNAYLRTYNTFAQAYFDVTGDNSVYAIKSKIWGILTT